MAGLMDTKNRLPKMRKPNGASHSTNVMQLIGAILVFAVIAAWFSSCKPVKQVHTVETSYKETFRDTTIYLRGEVVTAPLSSEFLNYIETVFNGDKKDTIRIASRNGNAELQLWKDEITGNIVAACEAKDREIEMLIKQIETLNNSHQETIIEVKEMPLWGKVLILFAVIYLFLSAILQKLNIRNKK
jgi:hypothetical protein